MNNTTTTTENEILDLARVSCEESDSSYESWMDELRAKDLADYDAQRDAQLSDQQEELICDPHGDDMSEYDDDQQDDGDDDDDKHGFNLEPREDNFRSDAEADADVLASAGHGTDEDYGYFGGDEGW
jgi:hypothetical protein